MQRAYAGILGWLALVVAIVRGWLTGADTNATIQTALVAMVALAGVGAVLGGVAARVVDESVRGRFAAELASRRDARASAGRVESA